MHPGRALSQKKAIWYPFSLCGREPADMDMLRVAGCDTDHQPHGGQPLPWGCFHDAGES